MKNNLQIYICFLLFSVFNCHATIKIVLTAAITEQSYEFRKREYIESFKVLSQFGYPDVYVVEALKKQGPTFLDEYSRHVFYATLNNPAQTTCINEAKTLLEGLHYFRFEPEDIIIKITGRYHLISDYVLKIVETHPNFDAFVKIDTLGAVFTLGFAMKYRYLLEMYESLDYAAITQCPWVNVERQMGEYLTKKEMDGNFKVWYLDKLDIKANNYGSTTVPVLSEEIVIF